MGAVAAGYRRIKRIVLLGAVAALVTTTARGQIQLDLKLPRLQFIAYEPIIATVGITNLAGRDIDLADQGGQTWFGLEITGSEGQPIAAATTNTSQPTLHIESGSHVTQKINLAPLYAVHELGTYHVRAYIHFADLNRFFYSPKRVFEVTEARPIWQNTVGIPANVSAPGKVRTYSLLTNRFPNHTSLYVRVEDKDTGVVYATYSLGRIIASDEPQAQLDRENQLHVLHCAAPRTWTYSRIGLNGESLAHSSFIETKTRPRLVRTDDGAIDVRGGMAQVSPAPEQSVGSAVPKLSDRPPQPPKKAP